MEGSPDNAAFETLANWLSQLGWVLPIGAWAIAAVALLAGVFLPRVRRGPGFLLALAAMGLVLAVSCQTNIDRHRGWVKDQDKRWAAMGVQDQYLYLPRGSALRYCSCGNQALMADFVYLTGLQYVSNEFKRGEKFDMLKKFFDVMMDLDPHWISSLKLAGLLLAAVDKDPARRKAEAFYKDAIQRNVGRPEVWRLHQGLGYLFIFPPDNPDDVPAQSAKAVEYLEPALQCKDIPLDTMHQLRQFIARLKLEVGTPDLYGSSAQRLFEEAQEKSNPEALQEASAKDFLYAESMRRVGELSDLLRAKKKETGRWPASLARKDGQVPYDAYGYPIEYDPETGRIESVGALARAAYQKRGVLRSHVTIFYKTKGHYPESLEELQAFLRERYRTMKPDIMLIQSLGKELDCLGSPLGGRLEYSPVTGEISMPAYVSLDIYWRNYKDVMAGKAPPAWGPPGDPTGRGAAKAGKKE